MPNPLALSVITLNLNKYPEDLANTLRALKASMVCYLPQEKIDQIAISDENDIRVVAINDQRLVFNCIQGHYVYQSA